MYVNNPFPLTGPGIDMVKGSIPYKAGSFGVIRLGRSKICPVQFRQQACQLFQKIADWFCVEWLYPPSKFQVFFIFTPKIGEMIQFD